MIYQSTPESVWPYYCLYSIANYTRYKLFSLTRIVAQRTLISSFSILATSFSALIDSLKSCDSDNKFIARDLKLGLFNTSKASLSQCIILAKFNGVGLKLFAIAIDSHPNIAYSKTILSFTFLSWLIIN